ncbi:MAG: hypothetical protein AB4062_07850 [Crocosphaera sp.]
MVKPRPLIIDHHPNYNNILIEAGFSGHGFKFTNLVGKILADIITEGRRQYDLS